MDSKQSRSEYITGRAIELAAKTVEADPALITMQTHFVNDLQFDSLDRFEYAMALEEEFKLSIDDAEVDQLQTVGDVVAFIERQPKERST